MKETYSQSDSIITSLQSEISSYEVKVKDLNRDVLELESKNEMLMSANKDLNKALERKVIVNINKEEVNGK